MSKPSTGFFHLTLVFLLAVLALMLTYTLRQQTRLPSQATPGTQYYYGLVRKNNYFDCNSGYHLVNIEEDEVAHCLSTPPQTNLSEFLNNNVKIFGELFEISDKRHLLIETIEKRSANSTTLPKDKIFDVLGSFIKRIIP